MNPSFLPRTSEESAFRLSMIRIVIGIFFLFQLLVLSDELRFLATRPHLEFSPVGVALFLEGPITALQLEALHVCTVLLALLWTLGFAWRLIAPLFALSIVCWFGYFLSWGSITHAFHYWRYLPLGIC